MTISKQQMEQLLVILGILIIIVLLVPPIWVRLALFIIFLGGLIFCIISLYQNSTVTVKTIAYLTGFIVTALGVAKMIVYFAETIPKVGIAVTIALGIMSFIFIAVLCVKFIIWLYSTLKSRNDGIT